jgi:hypothetical protein
VANVELKSAGHSSAPLTQRSPQVQAAMGASGGSPPGSSTVSAVAILFPGVDNAGGGECGGDGDKDGNESSGANTTSGSTPTERKQEGEHSDHPHSEGMGEADLVIPPESVVDAVVRAVVDEVAAGLDTPSAASFIDPLQVPGLSPIPPLSGGSLRGSPTDSAVAMLFPGVDDAGGGEGCADGDNDGNESGGGNTIRHTAPKEQKQEETHDDCLQYKGVGEADLVALRTPAPEVYAVVRAMVNEVAGDPDVPPAASHTAPIPPTGVSAAITPFPDPADGASASTTENTLHAQSSGSVPPVSENLKSSSAVTEHESSPVSDGGDKHLGGDNAAGDMSNAADVGGEMTAAACDEATASPVPQDGSQYSYKSDGEDVDDADFSVLDIDKVSTSRANDQLVFGNRCGSRAAPTVGASGTFQPRRAISGNARRRHHCE